MSDSKFVWKFAAAFGLGLLFATSVRAQLSVNDREPDAFGLFGVENPKEAFVPQSLKFDMRIDSTPTDHPQLVSVSDHGFGSPLLAGFDQSLAKEPAANPGVWLLPGDSLRIPEPATFGLLGFLMLFGLMALQRVRHKSAVLAV